MTCLLLAVSFNTLLVSWNSLENIQFSSTWLIEDRYTYIFIYLYLYLYIAFNFTTSNPDFCIIVGENAAPMQKSGFNVCYVKTI